MTNKPIPDIFSTAPFDALGTPLRLGDRVARPVKKASLVFNELCVVTRLDETGVYLDDSNRPLVYPSRVVILHEPTP